MVCMLSNLPLSFADAGGGLRWVLRKTCYLRYLMLRNTKSSEYCVREFLLSSVEEQNMRIFGDFGWLSLAASLAAAWEVYGCEWSTSHGFGHASRLCVLDDGKWASGGSCWWRNLPVPQMTS